MIMILFLAANPNDTNPLRLGEESRAIKERLRLADLRDQFAFVEEHAVRVADLQGHLLHHQPHIVHFSGHGSKAGQIILEDLAGHSKPVPQDALKKLFTTLKKNIRCVVLNACYSEAQAKGIAKSIDCVVGMGRAIDDRSAIAFAASFYQGLGYGESIQTAFELGCGGINLQGLSGHHVPKLKVAPGVTPASIYLVESNSQAPHVPKLKVAPGVAPASSYLVESNSQTPQEPLGRPSSLTSKQPPSAGWSIQDGVVVYSGEMYLGGESKTLSNDVQESIRQEFDFIKYISKDQAFAQKLESRLKAEGVDNWCVSVDLPGGNKKLRLSLSREAMQSKCLAIAIEKALNAEKKKSKSGIPLMRLINLDQILKRGCLGDLDKYLGNEIREYFIPFPFFWNWKDDDAFEAAFAWLLKDLKAEESTGAKPG